MQKLPITTKRHDVEIKSIGGQSIFNYYKQIQKILGTEYPNEKIGAFIAEPVFSERQDEINWYTNLKGSVIPFHKLNTQQKISVLEQLKNFNEKTEKLIEKISKIDGVNSSGIQALKYLFVCPNIEESLFAIDERIIITQWGCVPFGKNPDDFNIIIGVSDGLKGIESLSNSENNDKNPVDNGNKLDFVTDLGKTREYDQIEPKITEEDKLKSSTEKNPDEIPIHGAEERSLNENVPWRIIFLIILILIIIFLLIWNAMQFNNVNKIGVIESNISDLTNNIQNKIDSCSSKICKDLTTVGSAPMNLNQNLQSVPDSNTRRQSLGISGGKKLNFSLIWDAPVDLDLIVVEPNGNAISFENPRSASGGKLDVDQNQFFIVPHPIENISYDDISLHGVYKVKVFLYSYKNFSKSNSVNFDVEIKDESGTKKFHNTFPPNSEKQQISVFELNK